MKKIRVTATTEAVVHDDYMPEWAQETLENGDVLFDELVGSWGSEVTYKAEEIKELDDDTVAATDVEFKLVNQEETR